MISWNYYSVFCGFFGILLFLYGFFLSSTYTNRSSFSINVDENIFNEKSNIYRTFETHKSTVDKVVIMVIDALRYDFIASKQVVTDMPFVASLLNASQACLFPCRVHLPTVTMPRIKAITVGSVSNFVDIVLNLGSSEVHQDNILSQAVKMRKNIIFYGDDTWIKLFPREFSRYEGTTSFFVSDFVEVDDNVTRNVVREIKQEDWDMMILHYLGLDHIGHLEGPFSSKISWKLNEMDGIIKLIYLQLEKWKKEKKQEYLMIVCGDHGMKDTGGHGGSTLGEVLVPFLVLGKSCRTTPEIFQVDIAVTISLLMGLPIPQENVGKVIYSLIDDLPLPFQLDAHYQNVKQLIQNYNEVIEENSELGPKERELYLKTMRNKQENEMKQVIHSYRNLLSQLSSKLIDSLTRFDTLCLYLAVVILLHASCLPSICSSTKIPDMRYVLFLTVLVYVSIFQICFVINYNSTLCTVNPSVNLFTFLLSFIVSFNMVSLLKHAASFVKYLKTIRHLLINDIILLFTIVCSIMQIFSTISTSFIEEEHMIWYYFWTTWLVLTLVCSKISKKDSISLVIVLIMNRIVRKLNQTGDQWASLPDISDWLIESHHKQYLSIFFILGLIWTFFSMNCFDYKKRRKYVKACHFLSILNKCFAISCLTLIYFYRSAVKEVLIFDQFQHFLSDKGIFEFEVFVYVFLVTAALKFIYICLNSIFSGHSSTVISIDILKAFIDMWMLSTCMLLRPSNIILPSSLILSSKVICKILRKQSNEIFKLIIIHHWLARVYFFYQGNSNSLASIDIASGYTGQTTYNSVVVGSLIICCTYSMPVLAYLLMIRHYIGFLAKNFLRRDWNITRSKVQISLSIWLTVENFAMFFYMIVIMIFKYHLFIWSVFSPKLLYLSAYYVLLYPVVVLLQLFLNVYSSSITL